MKNILNNVIVRLLINALVVALLLVGLYFLFNLINNKQIKKDCLNAQRHLINYNVPIPEDLNSLCVENNYYENN